MPLRGLLFKKLIANRKQRQEIERQQLANHFKKQKAELDKLKKIRVEEQARDQLRRMIAAEKAQIKAAKSTRKISRFERFIAKEAKAGGRAAAKLAAKEAKAGARVAVKRFKKAQARAKRRKDPFDVGL